MGCQFIDHTCIWDDDLLKIKDVDHLHDYVLLAYHIRRRVRRR